MVRVVRSLVEAHLWAKHAAYDLDMFFGPTASFNPVRLIAGKKLRVSTACTGIDAPVLALRIIGVGVQSVAGELVEIENVHACEVAAACQEELLWSDQPPTCLFGNILDWLSDKQLSELKRVNDDEFEKIRDIIMSGALRAKAWCLAHGQECRMEQSDVNVSGTPCIHFSTFGTRSGMKGKANKVYYTWARQRTIFSESPSYKSLPTFPSPRP